MNNSTATLTKGAFNLTPDAPANVLRLTGLEWADALDLVMIYEMSFLTAKAEAAFTAESATVSADDIVAKTLEDVWSATAAGNIPANFDGTYKGAVKYMVGALKNDARDLVKMSGRYTDRVTTVASGADADGDDVMDVMFFDASVKGRVSTGNGTKGPAMRGLSAEEAYLRVVDSFEGVKLADELKANLLGSLSNPKHVVALTMFLEGRTTDEMRTVLGKWAVKDLSLAKKKAAAFIAETDSER
jgi:hypothetical protein